MKAVSTWPTSITHTQLQSTCALSLWGFYQGNYSKVIILSICPRVRNHLPWAEAVQTQLSEAQEKRPGRRKHDSEGQRGSNLCSQNYFRFSSKDWSTMCRQTCPLCPECTLSSLSYRLFLADSLWCGFECPPAEKGLRCMCLISWAHVQTTNLKFRHYHQCLYFPFKGCNEPCLVLKRQDVTTSPQDRTQVWVPKVWRRALTLDLSRYVSWWQTVEVPWPTVCLVSKPL